MLFSKGGPYGEVPLYTQSLVSRLVSLLLSKIGENKITDTKNSAKSNLKEELQ